MRHTVRSGETLGSIAGRLGLDVEELLRINPSVKDPERIFPGQSVYLPRRGTSGVLARWRGGGVTLEGATGPGWMGPRLEPPAGGSSSRDQYQKRVQH